MSFWIDTHCHMNEDLYKEDFEKYLENADKNDVKISNLICMNKEQLEYSLALKAKYPGRFIISFGYFPEDIQYNTDTDMAFLEQNIDKIDGIGEIGLDYHYGKENVQQQKEMFIKQIKIANKYNKPIMIHSRDAANDTYSILKEYAKTKVLLHCYSDSLEMMNNYLKLGYFISFSGVVTFVNAKIPKINAKEIPLDKMMIETDCPYLTPVPFRGKTNETAFVRYTGEYIANLRNIECLELQEQLKKNFSSFFEVTYYHKSSKK